MIVITGAAGFIGSCMVGWLNASGRDDLLLSDDFSKTEKADNLEGKHFLEKIDRDDLIQYLESREDQPEWVIHLGARTDTAEKDEAVFDRLNLNYSKAIWNYCTEHRIPLLYASSAAVYGDGALGFSDAHDLTEGYSAMNPYGQSKLEFDRWVLREESGPPFWAGFRFFNVYGPNEYHKGRMASVVWHAFGQIRETGRMKLFRSHRPDFADGEQSRDFIYVKDVCACLSHFMENRPSSGIFNLGTGTSRTFYDLVLAVFQSLEIGPQIEYMDTPADIRDTYQYFTEAENNKLSAAGVTNMYSLEQGVSDYVRNYLIPGRHL